MVPEQNRSASSTPAPHTIKGNPLFNESELQAFEAKTGRGVSWNEKKRIREIHNVEKTTRVKTRAEEYLDGLTVLVGCVLAGDTNSYVHFEDAFSKSQSDEVKAAVEKYDNPLVRRALYTILRAISEVPQSWAGSAISRFLLGRGKQKSEKFAYHGKGLLNHAYVWGVDEDGKKIKWSSKQVEIICGVLAGKYDYEYDYQGPLMTYKDVEGEVYSDPEIEISDIDVHTSALTAATRDKKFLERLCEMLEKRGLGPLPEREEAKPKKARKKKEFKPGDIVRKTTVKDLPFPAVVRVKVEKQDAKSGQWLPHELDWVVLSKPWRERVKCLRLGPKGGAYQGGGILGEEDLNIVIGGTFIGEFKGTVNRKKKLDYKFKFRKPESQ